MSFLFIQETIVQALCRTLVHSLWQGLLAAAAAGIVIMLTKRSKAVVRYNLLSVVFIAFIIISLITFLSQPGILNNSTNNTIIRFIPDNSKTIYEASVEYKWLPVLNKDSFYQSIIFYTDKYSAIITGTWLLFFCLHLLRMFAGLHYAHRIRFYKTNQPAGEWQQRLEQMARLLRIRETVSLMESGIVKVPVVTGMLKPIILVPAGMLSNLSSQQVEAILLHELAHVRRNDFFINLVQRFAESLFFFNPFIAWISARIREEREACCDDIVMKYTTDKRSYFEALISFREAGIESYSHAMSLGRNNKLLFRVKRMITQENKKLNAMEKLTLILILTAATAVSFMPAGKNDRKQKSINNLQGNGVPQEKKPVASFAPGNELADRIKLQDTLPGKQTITFSNISSVNNDDGKKRSIAVTAVANNGKTYSYRFENDELTDLAIDGVKIKKEDFNQYKPLIDQIEMARTDRDRNSIIKQKLAAAELMNQQEVLSQKLLELQKNNNNDIVLQEQKELLNKKLIQLELQNKNQLDPQTDLGMLLEKKMLAEKDYKLEELTNENNKLQLLQLTANNQNLSLMNQKLALQDMENQQMLQLNAPHNLIPDQKKNQLLLAQDQQFHNSNHELASILADLAEADVINDKNNFSFSLDDKELIVDGKKQSGSLHEMLRKKYIRHKKDYYRYKAKPNSRSTDVYVE